MDWQRIEALQLSADTAPAQAVDTTKVTLSRLWSARDKSVAESGFGQTKSAEGTKCLHHLGIEGRAVDFYVNSREGQ